MKSRKTIRKALMAVEHNHHRDDIAARLGIHPSTIDKWTRGLHCLEVVEERAREKGMSREEYVKTFSGRRNAVRKQIGPRPRSFRVGGFPMKIEVSQFRTRTELYSAIYKLLYADERIRKKYSNNSLIIAEKADDAARSLWTKI